jgi:N-methylhydantoinase A/oxoprolinase/acetone carboxylase beta subunit
MFITASHELSQEYREFERVSTVAANAYIGPKVRRYIGEIDQHIKGEGFHGSFLIVQSTGGLYESDQAQTQCVRMLESGPAAGVIGTQALCHALGLENAIAFDMGGTTAKAGVIHKGEALTTGAALIGGYDRALPVQIAMMDIFEVGTGGGSIARVEEGGLRVGPQSAGAAPGPACYGLGGREPTVTDAHAPKGSDTTKLNGSSLTRNPPELTSHGVAPATPKPKLMSPLRASTAGTESTSANEAGGPQGKSALRDLHPRLDREWIGAGVQLARQSEGSVGGLHQESGARRLETDPGSL